MSTPVVQQGATTTSTTDSVRPRVSLSLIKLQPYNATGSLDTFLARFQRMARYLDWTEEDQYYLLCASLEGAAGQVLWDTGPQATTGSIIHLLRTRFGSELQVVRFKAELRARRRGSGEPLQRLYREICRLVALAPILLLIFFDDVCRYGSLHYSA